MNGFTDEQVLEIRKGSASFDSKLDALAKFTASVVENRGRATEESKEAFFAAGYDEANMIDVIIVVGDKIISNYLHGTTKVPVDFPAAPALV
jgi:alkylhydroperoxidase family enzyme